MDNNRIDYLINRILSGVLIFYYKDKEYELRQPTPKIKYKASILYDQIINDEKYNTWIHESHMIRMMISLGLWDSDSDNMINTLEKNIEDSKLKLYENIKRPDIYKATKKNIRTLRTRLNKLNTTKNNFRNNTLEGYAESIKSEYIISNTLYSQNKKLFEKNDNKNAIQYTFFNGLIQEIYNNSISIEDIRTVSRSPQWRTFWSSNKDNVIGGPVSEWTDDQRTLVSYTRMYDNVYEHPDCPEDKVIEDDDTLDGWFIFQKKKRDREKNKSNITNKTNRRMDNAQEIFLFANENQTVEEIMDLNDTISKMKMKQKLSYVTNSDRIVEEHELPDVRTDLMNQRAEMQRMKRK